MELHLNSSLQTFFPGVWHHVPGPTPASVCTAGTRSHKARVQYQTRITAGTAPLSSELDLISGTVLLPDRQGRHQAGQCTGGMFEPLPLPALAHCVESRLHLSVPGLQQSLGIPNFAFSPFSLSISVS